MAAYKASDESKMEDHICCSDLADLVGGELILASLPPLGGSWEPVQRIVTELADVTAGDVFWSIDSNAHVPPDWAYASGALGVISPLAVEPWAGRLAIRIDDQRQALARLADFAIQRQLGTRILVLEEHDSTATSIHRLLSTRLRGEQYSGEHWPLEMLTNSAASDFIVVAINDAFLQINAVAPQSHLCSSDILVISSLANDKWPLSDSLRQFVVHEVSQLSDRNWLILNGDEQATLTLSQQTEARVVLCGEKPQCAVRVTPTDGNHPDTRVELAEEELAFRGALQQDILAAVSVAHTCNWSADEIRNGLAVVCEDQPSIR